MCNTKLVWSSDPKDQKKVEDEAKPKKAPEAALEFVNSHAWTAVFRIEKGGRGGKTVTVIDQLPRHERFVSDLCRELKNKCGSGGKFELGSEHGKIEIQGDKRAAIKAIFEKKGIRFKGM